MSGVSASVRHDPNAATSMQQMANTAVCHGTGLPHLHPLRAVLGIVSHCGVWFHTCIGTHFRHDRLSDPHHWSGSRDRRNGTRLLLPHRNNHTHANCEQHTDHQLQSNPIQSNLDSIDSVPVFSSISPAPSTFQSPLIAS